MVRESGGSERSAGRRRPLQRVKVRVFGRSGSGGRGGEGSLGGRGSDTQNSRVDKIRAEAAELIRGDDVAELMGNCRRS